MPYTITADTLPTLLDSILRRLDTLENTNLLGTTSGSSTGPLSVTGNISATGSISGNSLSATTSIAAASETLTGNLTAGSINSNGSVTAAANLVGGGLAVGASPTTVTQIAVYSPSLTPVALAASVGGQEQNFTVSGLTTADKVLVNPPSQTQNCPLVAARVSGLNTLTLTFDNATAAANTPASGSYLIVAIRS